MQVILLERIEKLGFMGDVVTVKPGYARNFLLPRKKALRVNTANLEFFEKQKKQFEADNLHNRKEAETVAEKMKSLSLAIIRQAGDSGQLYGSVTMRDIAEAATSEGFTLTRHQIVLDTPIKMLGLHKARIKLHPEVELTIMVNVAKSEEEAAAQMKSETAAETPKESEEGSAS